MTLSPLAQSLGLSADQCRRAAPFFAVYLMLFTALTIADAVAISMFASRIGADSLPGWYSATAMLSLVLIGVYLMRVTRHDSGTVFGVILATFSLLFLAAWGASQSGGGAAPLGMLFVTREIALTMVLMHFGTFLQDYFPRSELNQILPVIYAGGRLGGIVGGGAVDRLAPLIGTLQLVPVVISLLLIAWIGVALIARLFPRADEDETANPFATEPSTASGKTPVAAVATDSPTGRQFLRRLKTCPLLGWITITTLVFISCRWFLAFQYTSSFETHFDDDVALASFLGRYTQIALTTSLLFQLFVVKRLVARFGVATSHLAYCVCVGGGLLGNLLTSGLPMAVASRFIETEFRFALRNPVNQMMVNRFDKRTRIFVRGWSLGFLIPIATLLASGVIAGLSVLQGPTAIAIAGVVLGCGLLFAATRVGRAYDSFDRNPAPARTPGSRMWLRR